MYRENLLKDVRETLVNAGFYVSNVLTMRPVGFDLIARRDNSLLIIKVLTNINALSEEVAEELKTLASLLDGHPLLIGQHTTMGALEEDVVYDRFGIQAITVETLKHHLLEGVPLRVYAAPGGFYVSLDREKLVKLMRERQLSRGSFARSLHVSRKTIQMYEEGMNARIEVAMRMEDLLGDIIIKPIDILHGESTHPRPRPFTPEEEKERDLKTEVFTILQHIGYTIIPMGRGPFEALSKTHNRVMITCVQRYDRRIIKKARIISSISKITEKKAALFTDKKGSRDNIEGTPLIGRKELKTVREPEDIFELIVERMP
mgnify:CR=1 FL=1